MEIQLSPKNINFSTRELRRFRVLTQSRDLITTIENSTSNKSTDVKSEVCVTYTIFGSRPTPTPLQCNQIRAKLKAFSPKCDIKLVLLPVTLSQQVGSLSRSSQERSLFKGSSFQIILDFKFENKESVDYSGINSVRYSFIEQFKSLTTVEGENGYEFKPLLCFVPTRLGAVVPYRFSKVQELFKKQAVLEQQYIRSNLIRGNENPFHKLIGILNFVVRSTSYVASSRK